MVFPDAKYVTDPHNLLSIFPIRWNLFESHIPKMPDRTSDTNLNHCHIPGVRQIGKANPVEKLGSMCSGIVWNSSSNMLAAQQDGKFSVWLYPNAVYVDRDLLKLTCVEKVRSSSYFASPQSYLRWNGKLWLGALKLTWVRKWFRIMSHYPGIDRNFNSCTFHEW